MNNPGQTLKPASPRRQRVVLCCLVVLHLAVLGVGLFAQPDWIDPDDDNWRVPFVFGGLAAIVSLASVGFALGGLPLGTRLTLVVFTPIATWLLLALLFGKEFGIGDTPLLVVVAMVVNTFFLVQGVLMTSLLVWGRRRAATGRRSGAKVSRQFSLRHIMLWTLLTAIVLAGARTMPWDNWRDWVDAVDILEGLQFYAPLGAIQAGAGLVTFACLGLWPSRSFAMLAVVMAVVFTAVSFGMCAMWGATGNGEHWAFSLSSAVHFVLLSISLGLMRLAGHKFTRRADPPEETTTA